MWASSSKPRSAYVLAAWRRDDARSSEAGLKYFVLSAISSGLLLFGSSFVYGFTGSIRFDAIAAAVGEGAGGWASCLASC